MEGKGTTLIILSLLGLTASAQFTKSRQVTMRAHATVAPGFLLSQGGGVLNLIADGEYFVSNQASWRFDASLYLLSFGEPTFRKNHGVYAGICFRPTLRNFSPYAGFQPGIHLTTFADDSAEAYKAQLIPVISGIAGFNWYFIDFMHVTSGVRLLHGTGFRYNMAAQDPARPITELRVWIGLGIQIVTKRRKFDDR
jgi:hypothetical protein